MISKFECYAKLVVPAALLTLTFITTRASGGPPTQKVFDKLPLSREFATQRTDQRFQTTVEWNRHEYDVETGIGVLMSVVRDPGTGADERHSALLRLAMLRTRLEGRPCLDELARLFDAPGEVDKGGILLCFQSSDDPRGLPVFHRTLDKEQSMKLRLSAAGSLAHWNIRRGVAELVKLLESNEILPQPARMPYVREKARDLFRTKNRLKGWGFPDEEVRKAILNKADLNDDQKRVAYIAEIKTWFESNKHRFPEWKPGDPLPEVEAVNQSEPAKNGRR